MADWSDTPILSSSFITHSGPNGNEIHFSTPDREKYLAVQETCRRQIDHAKPTNADRIRSRQTMSDEELAKFLCRVETDGRAYGPSGKAYWLNWLQSPAGGEENVH